MEKTDPLVAVLLSLRIAVEHQCCRCLVKEAAGLSTAYLRGSLVAGRLGRAGTTLGRRLCNVSVAVQVQLHQVRILVKPELLHRPHNVLAGDGLALFGSAPLGSLARNEGDELADTLLHLQ